MDKIRLLIADDHVILRDGIVSLFQTEETLVVAGTAGTGYEVLELLEKNEYDVCLLDINMPGLDGLDTARKIREKRPGIKIIMLTTYNDREIIAELVQVRKSERELRVIDHDREGSMELKKREGYF